MDARKRIADLAISDSGFVFDPYTGASYTVNATGLAVLAALKRGASSRSEITTVLEEGFERRGEDLDRDISEFLGLLRRYGLVDRDWELGA